MAKYSMPEIKDKTRKNISNTKTEKVLLRLKFLKNPTNQSVFYNCIHENLYLQ